MYTVEHFIQKFEAIPEDSWCVGQFKTNDGKHCALGHCAVYDGFISDSPEAIALCHIFMEKQGILDTTGINDGKDPRYQQNNPKERILAALRDVKANNDKKDL